MEEIGNSKGIWTTRLWWDVLRVGDTKQEGERRLSQMKRIYAAQWNSNDSSILSVEIRIISEYPRSQNLVQMTNVYAFSPLSPLWQFFVMSEKQPFLEHFYCFSCPRSTFLQVKRLIPRYRTVKTDLVFVIGYLVLSNSCSNSIKNFSQSILVNCRAYCVHCWGDLNAIELYKCK